MKEFEFFDFDLFKFTFRNLCLDISFIYISSQMLFTNLFKDFSYGTRLFSFAVLSIQVIIICALPLIIMSNLSYFNSICSNCSNLNFFPIIYQN